MVASFLARKDFWRVSSYSYPNPFSDNAKSREAWETLLSFKKHSSYANLKAAWAKGDYNRKLTHQGVESWKATFEEFGLLYVLSGTDDIRITPAGQQFFDAGLQGSAEQLEWIGLNLLFRYPLRGSRRPKSALHGNSDLLLYRFLFSIFVDCDFVLYWPEFERIISKVFYKEEANIALGQVRALRSNVSKVSSYDLPVVERKGAFYNSLNQVMMHASIGYALFDKTNDTVYPSDESARTHTIPPIKRRLIIDALRLSENAATESVAALPAAPEFSSEHEYFDYLGRLVSPSSVSPLSEPTFTKTASFPPISDISVKDFQPTGKSKKSKLGGSKGAGGSDANSKKRKSDNAKFVGDWGEEIVLAFEKDQLIKRGRQDLLSKVVHEAKLGRTPGWDVSSVGEDGEPIFIEVKATTGDKMSNFTLTDNEWRAARKKEQRDRYFIYLVFNALSDKNVRIEKIHNPYQRVKNGEVSIALEAVSIGL
ncbi:MAG: DUF3883 domain-containing protein [Alphaproteobacteria bacterium]|nr:MAG: DUF3883 domain-containing protein [Alphaproteobacteria bacterium]